MASIDYVYLECIKEGKKLRVKIISPGYNNNANCQFPRAIRTEGCKYKCRASAISVAKNKGGFFYRVAKKGIEILKDSMGMPEKIYEMVECCVCMDEESNIVLVPCGHLVMCKNCSKEIEKCPICRQKIIMKINKNELR